MKDGTVKKFPHEGRAGGSYTKTLSVKAGFVVVEDEWQKKTYIPSEDIAKVHEWPHR